MAEECCQKDEIISMRQRIHDLSEKVTINHAKIEDHAREIDDLRTVTKLLLPSKTFWTVLGIMITAVGTISGYQVYLQAQTNVEVKEISKEMAELKTDIRWIKNGSESRNLNP